MRKIIREGDDFRIILEIQKITNPSHLTRYRFLTHDLGSNDEVCKLEMFLTAEQIKAFKDIL
jgi:hypothetical protein